MNIGVIILNYLAYNETINCVNSFLQQDFLGNDFHIVIVDNASPNESVRFLNDVFCNNNKVSIIQSDKNLGFAKGNNLGYETLLRIFEPDFVVFSNDDIVLKQSGMVEWIINEYELFRYAVLGPSIYSTRGDFYQNPVNNFTIDIRQCKREITSNRIRVLKQYIKKIIRFPIKGHYGEGNRNRNSEKTTELTLHGSFQVFSREYFQQYDEPYDSGTFMYHEEDILKLRCRIKNLVMLYSPAYEVDHLQAVATNMSENREYNRIIRREKICLKSLLVFYNLLKEYNDQHLL